MKSVAVIFVVGFFLLLLLMNRKQVRKVLELLPVYWFRIAFSFLLLFAMNIVAGFIGIYVPINIASGLLIAILGIPGFVSICVLALLL